MTIRSVSSSSVSLASDLSYDEEGIPHFASSSRASLPSSAEISFDELRSSGASMACKMEPSPGRPSGRAMSFAGVRSKGSPAIADLSTACTAGHEGDEDDDEDADASGDRKVRLLSGKAEPHRQRSKQRTLSSVSASTAATHKLPTNLFQASEPLALVHASILNAARMSAPPSVCGTSSGLRTPEESKSRAMLESALRRAEEESESVSLGLLRELEALQTTSRRSSLEAAFPAPAMAEPEVTCEEDELAAVKAVGQVDLIDRFDVAMTGMSTPLPYALPSSVPLTTTLPLSPSSREEHPPRNLSAGTSPGTLSVPGAELVSPMALRTPTTPRGSGPSPPFFAFPEAPPETKLQLGMASVTPKPQDAEEEPASAGRAPEPVSHSPSSANSACAMSSDPLDVAAVPPITSAVFGGLRRLSSGQVVVIPTASSSADGNGSPPHVPLGVLHVSVVGGTCPAVAEAALDTTSALKHARAASCGGEPPRRSAHVQASSPLLSSPLALRSPTTLSTSGVGGAEALASPAAEARERHQPEVPNVIEGGYYRPGTPRPMPSPSPIFFVGSPEGGLGPLAEAETSSKGSPSSQASAELPRRRREPQDVILADALTLPEPLLDLASGSGNAGASLGAAPAAYGHAAASHDDQLWRNWGLEVWKLARDLQRRLLEVEEELHAAYQADGLPSGTMTTGDTSGASSPVTPLSQVPIPPPPSVLRDDVRQEQHYTWDRHVGLVGPPPFPRRGNHTPRAPPCTPRQSVAYSPLPPPASASAPFLPPSLELQHLLSPANLDRGNLSLGRDAPLSASPDISPGYVFAEFKDRTDPQVISPSPALAGAERGREVHRHVTALEMGAAPVQLGASPPVPRRPASGELVGLSRGPAPAHEPRAPPHRAHPLASLTATTTAGAGAGAGGGTRIWGTNSHGRVASYAPPMPHPYRRSVTSTPPMREPRRPPVSNAAYFSNCGSGPEGSRGQAALRALRDGASAGASTAAAASAAGAPPLPAGGNAPAPRGFIRHRRTHTALPALRDGPMLGEWSPVDQAVFAAALSASRSASASASTPACASASEVVGVEVESLVGPFEKVSLAEEGAETPRATE